MTTTTKSRPFKKFYCDDRDVFRLPGTALKIWLYHYSRERETRKSWPTAETICAELDINQDTLFRWRKYLVTHGWLEKVGDHRRLDGEFSVPEYKVRKGTVTEKIVDGHPDKRRGNRTDKALAARKNHARTHTKKSCPTDTKSSSTDAHEKIRDEVDSGLLDSEKGDSGLLEKSKAKASPHSFKGESQPQPRKRNGRDDTMLPVFAGELRDAFPESGLATWPYLCALQDAIRHRAELGNLDYWQARAELEEEARQDQTAGACINVEYFLSKVPLEKRLWAKPKRSRSLAEEEYAAQVAREEVEHEGQRLER